MRESNQELSPREQKIHDRLTVSEFPLEESYPSEGANKWAEFVRSNPRDMDLLERSAKF